MDDAADVSAGGSSFGAYAVEDEDAPLLELSGGGGGGGGGGASGLDDPSGGDPMSLMTGGELSPELSAVLGLDVEGLSPIKTTFDDSGYANGGAHEEEKAPLG
eukprot:CAMPEP_0118853892 /NCGR_PEP_ID=MMETSP1163-20130328/2311_1 /TAXON_ID=124430 /ORGANISM="Phaeomonas parva, Strain CCMP2877" /LENGTH=102 /DNA_ID=CAMNT_0006786519 /DNA_START=88 /DNA_END=392 /DNA_ORIENTATION=+